MIKSMLSCLYRFIYKNDTNMTKTEDPQYEEPNFDEFIPIDNPFYEPGLDCSNMLSVPDHRSGWNYVTEYCKKIHNPNGYLLVDFVEKMWCWNKLKYNENKGVFYDNVAYSVPFNDIKMINGIEYAILEEDLSVYWNGDEWVKSNLPIKIKESDTCNIYHTVGGHYSQSSQCAVVV